MERILMGSVVAFVILTLVCYFLILINLPYLIIPITLAGFYFCYKPFLASLKQIRIRFTLQTFILLLVFALGIGGQLAIISPSGLLKNGELIFWSAHAHDGTWHIALMEEIKNGWPLQNPTFSGKRLVNYHFFSDILPAFFSKYIFLSNFDLYFRIFPFIYSILLGSTSYFLVKRLTNNFGASLWATIFTYFAGSFGYVIGRGESVFWATQPQSSSGNPPQIISNVILLASFYFLHLFLTNKKSRKLFVVCVILFGSLVSFKVYAGIVLLVALGIGGVWQLIRERDFKLLMLCFLSGVLSLLLYLPNTKNSAGFLIYEPWWYIRTMIVEPSRLNLIDWELRRQTYIFEKNWKRVIYLEGLGFLIFFFGNIGMRLIGLWDFVKLSKNSLKNYFNLVFVATIFLSIALPLLFLQKGVASNTSQFLQYFVLLFGILAGISTERLTSRFKFLIPFVIFLMVPTQVQLLKDFYGRPPFAKISSNEIEALNFIKKNTPKDTEILTPPYNPYLDLKQTSPHIWDWFDTSYVAALSSRRTYMDDYEQLDIMGYDYNPRLETKKKIFEGDDFLTIKTELSNTKTEIVYFPKILRPKIDLEKIGLSKIFENGEVEVWKIN